MSKTQNKPFTVVVKKPSRRAIAKQNAEAMQQKALEKMNAAYDRSKA